MITFFTSIDKYPGKSCHVRYLLICCVALIIANRCHGSPTANENYLVYHERIIKCEEEFLFRNNISAALDCYRKVFSDFEKPFAKDCFIALQLACYINDTAKARFFFEKAFKRGVMWMAVDLSPVVKQFLIERPDFKKQIGEQYPLYKAEWERGLNMNLRATVVNMKRRDVSAKIKSDHFERNSIDAYKADSEYIDILDDNAIQLVRLTRQYGFLGDNVIGLTERNLLSDSNNIDKEACYSLRSLVDQLFLHQCCCFFLLQPELKQALIDGEISPPMYALIYEWAYEGVRDRLPSFRRGHPPNKVCAPLPERQAEFYNVNPHLAVKVSDTALVAKFRRRISLPSEEHIRRKKAFEKNEMIKLFFGAFDVY